MNKLFITNRCSCDNIPNVGEQCIFSPCIILLSGITDTICIDNRCMLQLYMRENNFCTVVKHGDYVCHVRFMNQDTVDIVSYDFLLKKQLSSFGKNILFEE